MLLPPLRTLAEIGLFYGGLAVLSYGTIPPWELLLLSVAVGGTAAFAIARLRPLEGSQAIGRLGKRTFFIPSALLFLCGWVLERWANLPQILFQAGLAVFLVSSVLCLQRLESELAPEVAIAFLQLALFLPYPVFLAIAFNLLPI